jgi:hypothetical protein
MAAVQQSTSSRPNNDFPAYFESPTARQLIEDAGRAGGADAEPPQDVVFTLYVATNGKLPELMMKVASTDTVGLVSSNSISLLTLSTCMSQSSAQKFCYPYDRSNV